MIILSLRVLSCLRKNKSHCFIYLPRQNPTWYGFWLLCCFFSRIGPDTTHIRIVFYTCRLCPTLFLNNAPHKSYLLSLQNLFNTSNNAHNLMRLKIISEKFSKKKKLKRKNHLHLYHWYMKQFMNLTNWKAIKKSFKKSIWFYYWVLKLTAQLNQKKRWKVWRKCDAGYIVDQKAFLFYVVNKTSILFT